MSSSHGCSDASAEKIITPQTLGPIRSAIEVIRAWHARRRTLDALSRLSPGQLRDIGLTDADIERFQSGRF